MRLVQICRAHIYRIAIRTLIDSHRLSNKLPAHVAAQGHNGKKLGKLSALSQGFETMVNEKPSVWA